MSIAPTPPASGTTLLSGLQQLRADTQALTNRSDGLGEEYGSIATLSNSSYNSAQDAYENATEAANASATGSGAGASAGPVISGDAATISSGQGQLTTVSNQSVNDLASCQNEAQRLSAALTSLASTMAPGPAATAVQQALAEFGAGANLQNGISFDASFQLQEAAQSLNSLTGDAAQISAIAAAGGDVSASGGQAEVDAQSLQTDYGQIANEAYPAGSSELQASGYFQQAGNDLDQALGQLAPSTPPT